MTTLEKIGIQGIRSYSDEDVEVLEFSTPITIIYGNNGSGKSTIIECLKVSCTGDFPPNAEKGKSFLHDPLISNKMNIRGKIDVLLNNYNNKRIGISRSYNLFYSKDKNKKVKHTFRALDNNIIIKKEKGDDLIITNKCVDINNHIPKLMGVSKALLDNVIFCHHDENLWPFSESIKIKKKFDELFGDDHFSKILEELLKCKKYLNDLLKRKEYDLIHLKENYEKKKYMNIEIQKYEKEIESAQICIQLDVEEIQENTIILNNLIKKKNLLYKLIADIDSYFLLYKKFQIDADTYKDLKEIYEESYTELLQFQDVFNKDINKYQMFIQNVKQDINNLQQEKQTCMHNYKESNTNDYNHDLTKKELNQSIIKRDYIINNLNHICFNHNDNIIYDPTQKNLTNKEQKNEKNIKINIKKIIAKDHECLSMKQNLLQEYCELLNMYDIYKDGITLYDNDDMLDNKNAKPLCLSVKVIEELFFISEKNVQDKNIDNNSNNNNNSNSNSNNYISFCDQKIGQGQNVSDVLSKFPFLKKKHEKKLDSIRYVLKRYISHIKQNKYKKKNIIYKIKNLKKRLLKIEKKIKLLSIYKNKLIKLKSDDIIYEQNLKKIEKLNQLKCLYDNLTTLDDDIDSYNIQKENNYYEEQIEKNIKQINDIHQLKISIYIFFNNIIKNYNSFYQYILCYKKIHANYIIFYDIFFSLFVFIKREFYKIFSILKEKDMDFYDYIQRGIEQKILSVDINTNIELKNNNNNNNNQNIQNNKSCDSYHSNGNKEFKMKNKMTKLKSNIQIIEENIETIKDKKINSSEFNVDLINHIHHMNDQTINSKQILYMDEHIQKKRQQNERINDYTCKLKKQKITQTQEDISIIKNKKYLDILSNILNIYIEKYEHKINNINNYIISLKEKVLQISKELNNINNKMNEYKNFLSNFNHMLKEKKYNHLKEFINYLELTKNELKIKKKNLWMLHGKEDLMNEFKKHIQKKEKQNCDNNKKTCIIEQKKCLLCNHIISENNKDIEQIEIYIEEEKRQMLKKMEESKNDITILKNKKEDHIILLNYYYYHIQPMQKDTNDLNELVEKLKEELLYVQDSIEKYNTKIKNVNTKYQLIQKFKQTCIHLMNIQKNILDEEKYVTDQSMQIKKKFQEIQNKINDNIKNNKMNNNMNSYNNTSTSDHFLFFVEKLNHMIQNLDISIDVKESNLLRNVKEFLKNFLRYNNKDVINIFYKKILCATNLDDYYWSIPHNDMINIDLNEQDNYRKNYEDSMKYNLYNINDNNYMCKLLSPDKGVHIRDDNSRDQKKKHLHEKKQNKTKTKTKTKTDSDEIIPFDNIICDDAFYEADLYNSYNKNLIDGYISPCKNKEESVKKNTMDCIEEISNKLSNSDDILKNDKKVLINKINNSFIWFVLNVGESNERNGEIKENKKNDINGMDNDINGMDDDINGMDNDINGMDDDINGMDNDINRMDDDINKMDDDIKKNTCDTFFKCSYFVNNLPSIIENNKRFEKIYGNFLCCLNVEEYTRKEQNKMIEKMKIVIKDREAYIIKKRKVLEKTINIDKRIRDLIKKMDIYILYYKEKKRKLMDEKINFYYSLIEQCDTQLKYLKKYIRNNKKSIFLENRNYFLKMNIIYISIKKLKLLEEEISNKEKYLKDIEDKLNNNEIIKNQVICIDKKINEKKEHILCLEKEKMNIEKMLHNIVMNTNMKKMYEQYMEHHQKFLLSLNQLKTSFFFFYDRENGTNKNISQIEYTHDINGDKKQIGNDNNISSNDESINKTNMFNHVENEINYINDIVKKLEENYNNNTNIYNFINKTFDITDSLKNKLKDIIKIQEDDLNEQIEKHTKSITALKIKEAEMNGKICLRKEYLEKLKEDIKSKTFINIDKEYKKKIIEIFVYKNVIKDIQNFHFSFDQAIIKFHSLKMQEINLSIKNLWRRVYNSADIDYIYIKSDVQTELTEKSSQRRSYNYRVVMVKDNCELDMKGRCSSGQKVLSSIIIRLALAESFSIKCGILALDEPTTNLDKANSRNLARLLANIVELRKNSSSFQLILITHDNYFVDILSQYGLTNCFYKIKKNNLGYSKIERLIT
ncbi:DNA repair protein RAD50, putative [Plasmodium sp. gorilla clade G2]|uniref:DNA repair protein RAD50, putative n=1 Tax=Plasmodium sp. gorilla clade G2 TaxID=880535 RepID=UPI000D20DFBE|nr:DNA repair protein RAD50, putative [Plasmodium sp. gorilla clade G2]SOV12373.1 DNA repair protein RAD50, putative [Plasmodium sp. gorilla clade G2]